MFMYCGQSCMYMVLVKPFSLISYSGHVLHSSIESIPLQESCAQYWPSEGSSQFGEFTVKLVEQEDTSGLVLRKFIVESAKVCIHRYHSYTSLEQ